MWCVGRWMELGIVSIDVGARFGSVTVEFVVLMESGMGTGDAKSWRSGAFALGRFELKALEASDGTTRTCNFTLTIIISSLSSSSLREFDQLLSIGTASLIAS
jgi:hypothetical protein